MVIPACLVTSTPDFTPPTQTRPFIIPSSADPDPRAVKVLDDVDPDAMGTIDFKAQIVSDDQLEQVAFQVYIDYGVANPVTSQPFLVQDSNVRPLPASTMQETKPRIADAKVPPQIIAFGCHTVTLMASHHFDALTGCPSCANDSSFVTWPVYHCNSSSGPPCDPVDFAKCTVHTGLVSCPAEPAADPGAVSTCRSGP
jgi:hypothetical protein